MTRLNFLRSPGNLGSSFIVFQRRALVAVGAVLVAGCGPTDESADPGEGSQGVTGGSVASSSGGSDTGGGGPSSGGAEASTGGSSVGSGGTDTSTGGASGGSDTGTGGASGGSGGVGSGGDGTGGDVGAAGGSDGGLATGTFRVGGRHLYDRCGEKVVLRGVNEMIVWSGGKDGAPEYGEIAKTGANAVRIVWNEDGSAAELDVAIGNALDNDLIPMIEHHSATGDLSLVPSVVDYWVREDVNAIIKKYEPDLLLNIANEAGATVSQDAFRSTYETAITRLRGTGLVLPLIIDAPQWGQDIDMLQAVGLSLIDHDPEENLMFSVHMWWEDASGSRVVSELQESVDMNLPLIVGEFAQHAVYMCANAPFSYQTLLSEANKHEIGWLAWSWGGVNNADCAGQGSFDMTVGGTFGNWEEAWGEEVALTNQYSIQNTSVRPGSITAGTCP